MKKADTKHNKASHHYHESSTSEQSEDDLDSNSVTSKTHSRVFHGFEENESADEPDILEEGSDDSPIKGKKGHLSPHFQTQIEVSLEDELLLQRLNQPGGNTNNS